MDDLLASEQVVWMFFLRVGVSIGLLGVNVESISTGEIGTRLWDIPLYCFISVTNWELTFADGAGTITKLLATDAGGHIPAIYGEFVVNSSKEPETLMPHWSIDHAIDLEHGYNLLFGRITIQRSWVERSFQLSWVEVSDIHTIA